jgi:hypothetical protein
MQGLVVVDGAVDPHVDDVLRIFLMPDARKSLL